MSLFDLFKSHALSEGKTSLITSIDSNQTPHFRLKAASTNSISFGQTVVDPLSGNEIFPWTITVI